jgi:hypothetical protein
MKIIFKISETGLCETFHNKEVHNKKLGYGQFFSLETGFLKNVIVRKKFGRVWGNFT